MQTILKKVLLQARHLSLLALVFSTAQILAHSPGESYLFLKVFDHAIEGRLEMSMADLDAAVELDTDTDGKVSQAELDAKMETVRAYVLDRLRMAPDGKAMDLEVASIEMQLARMGKYALVHVNVPGLQGAPDTIDFDYSILFDGNPAHRGFLILNHNARTKETMSGEVVAEVFSPSSPKRTLDLRKQSAFSTFVQFLWEGIWHIWIGLDHILFLIALLLPAVLKRRAGRWEPTPAFRPALMNVLKIITLFTVAHSVTLCLAALGVVQLPASIVEPVIALSIAIAALNNVFQWFPERTGWIVYGFGLFHGFGFASVLADLGLRQGALVVPLFGFNVGVEIGQVAIICVAFPLLYALRRWRSYVPVIVTFGSLLLTALAIYWFVERVFLTSP